MHNTLWTSTEAAVVTGGETSCHWQAQGVSLNINEIRPGDLFLAAPHDDIELAYARGAAVVAVPRGVQTSDARPVLKIGSALMALQGLAAAARFRTHATVVSVQGRQARADMLELLSQTGHVHDGGKHVSLGLANLPEDADYGIFSASPAVRPDITIISNPETASRDMMFENMPRSGAVIVNADIDGFLGVIARAKAVGIQTILTYGRNAHADAVMHECLYADNGLRLAGRAVGEYFSLVAPVNYKENSMILAALLVLKINGKKLNSLVPQGLVSTDKKAGVTLLDSALGEKNGAQAVFRIRNLIDLGRGRQTAVLDNLGYKQAETPRKGLQIPRSFASFDFVHTGKGMRTVKDPHEAIRSQHRQSGIEQVVPDVLAPGDFLVFREIWNSSQTMFSEALRLIPESKRRNAHAV